MAIGDIYELVHEQFSDGQTMNNVYHFRDDSGMAAPGQTIATWFAGEVVPDVKNVQLAEVEHLELRVRNLFDAGDRYDFPLTGTGTWVPAETSPPASFISLGFTLFHNNGAIRPGSKRIHGGGEAAMLDEVWEPNFITFQMGAVASAIDNPLPGAENAFSHVIVKRILRPADLERDEPWYDLPKNQAEAQYGLVDQVDATIYITTQNSRKWYT